jgi:glutamyl/glutaminyl-tRNA synthetase
VRTTRKILDEMRADRERWEERDAERDRRWEERDAELQQVIRFNTEAFRRSELAFVDFAKGQRSFAEEHRRVIARLDEMGEEIRAQTRVIFAVIDSLEGGSGAQPAT